MILNHKSRRVLDRPVKVTIAASPPSPTLFKTLLEYNFAPVHVYGLTETYGPVMRYISLLVYCLSSKLTTPGAINCPVGYQRAKNDTD